MKAVRIRTLGEFSLQTDTIKISDTDNRTRKVWSLLAYLVCHRGTVVSQKKLIELLWGDDPLSANPENALRITFHRARASLNQLWPTAGHDLIIRKDGGYTWNPEIPVTVDSEEFDQLCSTRYPEEAQQQLPADLSRWRSVPIPADPSAVRQPGAASSD